MHAHPSPSVRHAVLPILGGLELLAARYARQRFDRHVHEEYALGVIDDGALGFRYRGQNVVAPAGAVNLVVPGEAHDGHAAAPDGFAYRMFYLPPPLLLTAARGRLKKPGLPHFRPGVLHDPALAALVAQTHQALLDPDQPLLAKEIRLLGLLCFWIGRHADETGQAPAPRPEPVAARRVRDLIHDRFDADLRLDDLATAAGLSPFHLVRVFEAATGLPPHRYLMETRLRQAKKRLAGPARLADIAAETGFADQSHLTRAFARRFGLTPGRYRNSVQNADA